MPNYYVYLISSLPMLHFGMKPPFSYEKFLEMCKRFVSDADVELLKNITQYGRGVLQYAPTQQTLLCWRAFEIALRNELVKARASRKHIDPEKYLRKDGYTEAYISHIAMNAHRNPSILEAERMLDQERWRFLDELSFGHYFDIDFLLIYALKLLILERWDKINTADKVAVLEEALGKN